MITQSIYDYEEACIVRDSDFSVDDLGHYMLIIQVGNRDLQFMVIDSRSSRCLVLEDYLLKGIKTVNTRRKLIKLIFDEHKFVKKGDWKEVRLCIKTHKFTLVPENMFVDSNAADYLGLNSEINTSFESATYTKLTGVNGVNIFSTEPKLCNWVQSMYKNTEVNVIHQGSALIEGVLNHEEDNPKGREMHCHADRGMLHIVGLENKKLLYYNQFAVKKKEDYLRYIMLVLGELSMSNKTDPLTLWGFISKESQLIDFLKKYIRHVSLGKRPTFLKFSSSFDALSKHTYFDLMGAYL